jgi:hypothetical protein
MEGRPMTTPTPPSPEPNSEYSDWPGSPLSTLHGPPATPPPATPPPVEAADLSAGRYVVRFALPAGIDDKDVTTTCQNGILEVSVGFEGKHAARNIQVTGIGTRLPGH